MKVERQQRGNRKAGPGAVCEVELRVMGDRTEVDKDETGLGGRATARSTEV